MKKTPLKRKSKSEKRKLEDAIHAEMRRIAINRHPYCVCCGNRDGILQGGHLIPKASSRAVRFDLMNLFTQCSVCNGRHRFNQSPYINWYIRTFGIEEHNKLLERSRTISHYKIQDLRDILEEYKKL